MITLRFPGKTNNKGITTVWAVVMLLLFSIACSGDKKEIVEVTYDPETTYTMKTTDVYTLISDSGLVRYRLVADEWYVYGKAEEPYWYFPEGFYFEQFDTLFQAESIVKSDTAYNWTKKELWKLAGNVELVNLKGDSIETSLLFFDREKGLIYSDKYVRIVREDGTIITGIGFETTQEMSNYVIYQVAIDIPMDESEQDSTARDSTGVRPVRQPVRRAAPPPHNPALNVPSRRTALLPDSAQLQLLEEDLRQREELIDIPIIENDGPRQIEELQEQIEDIRESIENTEEDIIEAIQE